jgi:hypothetical protein
MSSRSAAVIKVPLWRTLGEALRQVLGDLKAVGRRGWVPFLILVTFNLVLQLTPIGRFVRAATVSAASGANLQASLSLILFGLVTLVVQMFCYNGFMVSWYRHFLRPSGTGVDRGYWAAFWRVLGNYVLMVIAMIVFLVIVLLLMMIGLLALSAVGWIAVTPGQAQQSGARIGYIGSIVGAVLFGMCFVRFSLVFPAAASGSALGVRASWRKMRGNTWRLITAFLIVTAAYFVIALIPAFTFNSGALVAMISGSTPRVVPQPMILSIALGVVANFFLFLFLALLSSVTAIFYRELVLRPADVVEIFA